MLPSTITLGAHRWRLHLRDDAAMQAQQDIYREETNDDSILLGRCQTALLEIELRSHVGTAAVPYTRLAETALHEVLHALFDQIGLNHHPDEEAVISALAPSLLMLLRANPAFVTFLVAAEETPCS